jgi:hypothetical protein
MSNLLFDSPLWLWALLGVAFVALLASGARGNRSLIRAGAAVGAVIALLVTLNVFVQTDRDRILRGTRQLVHAVEARDRATLESLLDPHVMFDTIDKRGIIALATTYADQVKLQHAKLDSVEVSPDGENYVANISVTAEMKDQLYNTVPTSWGLLWHKSPAGWRIIRIELRSAAGQDPSVLRQILESAQSDTR